MLFTVVCKLGIAVPITINDSRLLVHGEKEDDRIDIIWNMNCKLMVKPEINDIIH